MMTSLRIFLVFLWRDCFIYWQRKSTYFINYSLLYPGAYAIAFAYIQTNLYFGPGKERLGTTIFMGNILLIILMVTYKITIDLLFDLEQDRFIDYQISLLSPRLVLLERALFAGLFAFVLVLPYLPVAKLLLQDTLVTISLQVMPLLIMLLVSTFFCATYQLFMSCFLKNSSYISQFWVRINQPLLVLGGFMVPFAIVKKYSQLLGYVMYANPFVYITDGLRQVVVGGPEFMPWQLCAGMLLFFSIVCMMLCWYFFKKRTDHI